MTNSTEQPKDLSKHHGPFVNGKFKDTVEKTFKLGNIASLGSVLETCFKKSEIPHQTTGKKRPI